MRRWVVKSPLFKRLRPQRPKIVNNATSLLPYNDLSDRLSVSQLAAVVQEVVESLVTACPTTMLVSRTVDFGTNRSSRLLTASTYLSCEYHIRHVR